LTAAILVARKGIPRVQVYRERLHLTDAGNPDDLFNHVRVCLDRLGEGTFPNRRLWDKAPQVGARASTNQFVAEVSIETQPVPVVTVGGMCVNAVLLDMAAVLLGGLGWLLWLFRSPQAAPLSAGDLWEQNIPYGLMVVTSLVTLLLSWRLFRMAYGLYNTFRFRSDVFWLIFTGTYTASKIGLGDGRGSQFFSHRERIQSDVLIELLAARVISECTVPQAWAVPEPAGTAYAGEVALGQPRYIVESVMDAPFGQRLAFLLDHLRSFRDSSNTLADVRISAPSAGEILGANLQIAMQSEAARLRAAQAAIPPQAIPIPPALPSPPPAVPPKAVPAVPAQVRAPVMRIIACPRCGQRYQAASGTRARFRCSHCQQLFDAVVS
jgi:hypothetical protein